MALRRAARPFAVALAPWLRRQAQTALTRTPSLPEAAGSREGVATNPRAPSRCRPHRLLVIGESTAAGVGVDHVDDALPSQLAREVAAVSHRSVQWAVRGRSGATAAYTVRKLVPAAPSDQDVAVVIVGVNDALRFTSCRRWRQQLLQLVEALSDRLDVGGRVVLVGLPDLGRFGAFPQPLRGLLGWHAQALDQQLRDVADRVESVSYVAMPPVSSPAWFARDGFHPNALACRAWATQLAPTVAAELPPRLESGGLAVLAAGPQLIYDGHCAPCTAAATWAVRHGGQGGRAPLRSTPSQRFDATGVDSALLVRAQREVQWLGADGQVRGGVSAVAQWCLHRGGWFSMAARLLRLPLLCRVAEAVYQLLARHHQLPAGTGPMEPLRASRPHRQHCLDGGDSR